ncbi:MAG: hypothetical protein OEY31_05160 [Candidatus Bathyarchaeota archaeon]|nr:hypothetical protein [Candidatus Bathyarchaeota archaeon]
MTDIIELHRSFWQMKNTEPLIELHEYAPLSRDTKIPLSDGRLVSDDVVLYPELIDPKLFVREIRNDGKASPIYGDFIRAMAPQDLCWTQALVGCPIRVNAGKVWAEPFLEDVTKIDLSSLKTNDKWLEKLLEFTRVLVEVSSGRYPVVQPLFRGPIDMAASALGPDKLCIAAYRHPDEFGGFLDFCSQTFIDAFNHQANLIPQFYDGYCCEYGIWAPKPICRDQADHSVLISPQLYEKVFLRHDLKIIDSSEYTTFHLHSATVHIANILRKIPKLSAIQVSIDYPAKAFSPPVEELMPTFKEIQKSKPLIITGPVTGKELSLILDELRPEGLALKPSIMS